MSTGFQEIHRSSIVLVPIGTKFTDRSVFTVKDLAARWAVSTATIYSLAKSGEVESLRIGNSIRFSESTVAAYEQTRIGAKPEPHPGVRLER